MRGNRQEIPNKTTADAYQDFLDQTEEEDQEELERHLKARQEEK